MHLVEPGRTQALLEKAREVEELRCGGYGARCPESRCFLDEMWAILLLHLGITRVIPI